MKDIFILLYRLQFKIRELVFVIQYKLGIKLDNIFKFNDIIKCATDNYYARVNIKLSSQPNEFYVESKDLKCYCFNIGEVVILNCKKHDIEDTMAVIIDWRFSPAGQINMKVRLVK